MRCDGKGEEMEEQEEEDEGRGGGGCKLLWTWAKYTQKSFLFHCVYKVSLPSVMS